MRYAGVTFLFLAVVVCPYGMIQRLRAQAPPAEFLLDRATALRADLDRLLSDARLVQAQVDIQVFSLDRSEILYEKNAQRLFIPASANKLITAAVALMRLGTEYRFETQVFADGPIKDGTLKGNLIIVGTGDPSLSPKFNAGDPFAVFKAWAGKLKEQNIRTISDAVLADDRAFKESPLGLGWEWNDLPYAYATPASALQFNDNMVLLQITPGTWLGSPVEIRATPLENYLKINNHAITVRGGSSAEIRIEHGDSSEAINVYGTVTETEPAILQPVAVRQPAHYYLAALQRALTSEGITATRWDTVRGKPSEPQVMSLLWTHASPPLPEIVKFMLKNSQNLYAETLVRALGLIFLGEGSFAKGKEVIEETLGQLGIAGGSHLFADGSGLSRLNLESADSFVRLLRAMRQDRNFQTFYDSLPVAGVDGTLSARMKRTKAENNVRAKTGTMSNVSSIAGYVKTADGETLAFALAVNNSLAPRGFAESIQDKVLEQLASFSRK